jgi:hypothetical protein
MTSRSFAISDFACSMAGDLLLLLREAQVELSLLRVEAVEEVGLLDVVRLHRGEAGEERVGVAGADQLAGRPGRSRLDLRGDDVADLLAELVDDRPAGSRRRPRAPTAADGRSAVVAHGVEPLRACSAWW